MDTYSQRLIERLRNRELMDLHESFLEVRQKFTQLEHAFEINLQSQQRREVELKLLRSESQEDVDKLDSGKPKTKNEFETLLKEISGERDQWKEAFLQQKIAFEKSKVERENFAKSIKRECEDILMVTRESAEKHFHEVVKLYEHAQEKSLTAQGQLEKLTCEIGFILNRCSKLANLLDTLQRFDISVDRVCRNTAEALRSLHKSEDVYEENLRNLRQLTWEFEKKNEQDSERDLLQIQNAVLRKIVKDLKRKIQNSNEIKKMEVPERDVLATKLSSGGNGDKSSNYDSVCEPDLEIGRFAKRMEKNSARANFTHDTVEMRTNSRVIDLNENAFPRVKFQTGIDFPEESMTRTAFEPARVETFESHFNGIPYEERVLRFARKQEIKIKYSPTLITNNFPLKAEFLDDEEEYLESAPLENRIYVFLKDVERVIRMRNNGTNCAIQTKKTKLLNNRTQTAITATGAPCRLNVGATMLNSEKRAIERSLGNLERTVADLKFNALSQARTLMDKDATLPRNNEFFECIRLLAR